MLKSAEVYVNTITDFTMEILKAQSNQQLASFYLNVVVGYGVHIIKDKTSTSAQDWTRSVQCNSDDDITSLITSAFIYRFSTFAAMKAARGYAYYFFTLSIFLKGKSANRIDFELYYKETIV